MYVEALKQSRGLQQSRMYLRVGPESGVRNSLKSPCREINLSGFSFSPTQSLPTLPWSRFSAGLYDQLVPCAHSFACRDFSLCL
jgi:hypothetical protein